MGVLHGIADVILILAALFSLIAFAFLAYAAWTVVRLVKEVKGEVGVISSSAKASLREVRETSRFMSESIVKPASVVIGYAAAVRATIQALVEDVAKKARS